MIVNIFSVEDQHFIDQLLSNDIIQEHKNRLSDAIPTVSFQLPLDHETREKLGVIFPECTIPESVPMRWILNDTVPHIDSSAVISSFEKSYLLYLTDSTGEFHIGDESFPIVKGTGFSFPHGVSHYTLGTSGERLLVGPMNEYGVQVGAGGMNYTNSDRSVAYAYDGTGTGNLVSVDYINTNQSSTIGTLQIYNNVVPIPSGQIQTGWEVGISSDPGYIVGDILGITEAFSINYPSSNVYIFPLFGDTVCFKHGTMILSEDEEGNDIYREIQDLHPGDLIKTRKHGFKSIDAIGFREIHNPDNSQRTKNRLYRLSKDNYPDLYQDLYLTGCHSILVDELSEKERKDTIEALGDVYITDDKYRLMAYLDEKSEPWSKDGVFTVYHIALEHDDPYMNYGIYANGLLVESTSQRMLKKLSGMRLVGQ